MNKVAKFMHQAVWENRLRENLATLDAIRTDGLNDLEILGEDFEHINRVFESVHRNYKVLLRQNQQMKDALFRVVDECYCWPGNRCDRCNHILHVIANCD